MVAGRGHGIWGGFFSTLSESTAVSPDGTHFLERVNCRGNASEGGRDGTQCPVEGWGQALQGTEPERQRNDTETGELGVWVLGRSRSSILVTFIFSVK